ncbi:helix-turn-helix transcriptional regulator [Actinosynnema sp. NPDC023658]|uniref:helix-turn-helix domain-containing protein n=1 Tax=Actinosynnema sp. NPDC023658 TaxID=3155465 RepID=UPI0033E873AD
MTTDESADSPWWDFVQRQLDDRAMSTADLSERTGLDRSRFTEWRRGKGASLDTARLVARAFDMSPLEVMVRAQLITAQEADLRDAAPDPAALTDQQLLAELGRRLNRRT